MAADVFEENFQILGYQLGPSVDDDLISYRRIASNMMNCNKVAMEPKRRDYERSYERSLNFIVMEKK